ncbi:MAG: sugar-binding protein [Cutibacterium acnes]|nr:sugar-binding protein [Cutibacterium acnes]
MPSSSHGRTNGRRALSSRQMMALDAARLYHLRGLDQAAVAQVLHVSRPQVSKLLATARELGYIRTHVVDPRESDRELVQTLTQHFRIAGLLLVSPSGPTTGDLLHALGAGAAHLTSNLVLPGEEDASFWWSRTVQACALEMACAPLRPRALYQCAGTAPGHDIHLSMRTFMERTDVEVHPCPVPLLHPSVTARLTAEESPEARQHESRRASSAVLILGSSRQDMDLICRSDLVTSQEREQIRRNAVGHLCGRFIDADGRVVAPTLGQRTSSDVEVHPCPVPLLHPSVTARLTAEESPEARQHESRRASSAVLILGSSRQDMDLICRSDLVTSQEREQIRRNAVGHLCGRFIDADGRVVAPTLGQRTSSPTLAQLRRSRRTVLITHGAHQVEFVRAATLRGYVDHIVTDVSTAELLLKYA